MLLEMLKEDKTFQDMTYEQQDIVARLASQFIEDSGNIFKTAEELEASTDIGNAQHWEKFLALTPVTLYIKNKMASIAQIASRKGFLSLQTQAQEGNVQAIKQINELAGILNKEDDNKVIIMHHIPRATLEEEVQ